MRGDRIGILLGGETSERGVSSAMADLIVVALVEEGYDVVPIFVDHDLDLGLRQAEVDVAWVACLGRCGDGPVQGLLESLGVPYTGSSYAAAALAADKLKTKELLRLHNLPTPTYYRHVRGGDPVVDHGAFGLPCVVKPRAGNLGMGVSVVDDIDDLEPAVESALSFDDEAIVERFVQGREVQVAIFDGKVLGVAEIAAETGVADVVARIGGRTRVTVPPRLPPDRLAGVVTQALRAHALLGCEGLTRVDLIVSPQGNESVLEVNHLPELDPGSVVAKILDAAGIEIGALARRVVESARTHSGRRVRERRRQEIAWRGDDRRLAGTSDPH